jgi:hypothetical protein|tara:strand:- start:903 stop:1145 length:243 start_codon:yes stop_codon:yes gene_type:complete
MKNERIVVRIPRSATSELLVVTGSYWNIDVLDIRWYDNGKPTKKGVRMNIDEAQSLNKALRRALNDNINKKTKERIEEET